MIVIQYFGLPIILISHVRNQDRKKQQELQRIKIQSILQTSSQVSHDIRSPLAALNMITKQLISIPEEQRVIMRNSVGRINDIANELLQKSLVKTDIDIQKNTSHTTSLTVELLPALIDVIVSEKRTQYRETSNILIEALLEDSYGSFAKINLTEFKRVLSNTINNSVEAIKSSDGKITISVKNYATKSIVSISDNGIGIPNHILVKLGQIGITHGKEGTESGSGIGVYHAKKTIESFGAKFEINSKEGHGTEIRIEFPACETPSWFVPKLKLCSTHTIVALDDDQSILEIWKQRIRDLGLTTIKLITLKSENDFAIWVENNSNLLNTTLFLMDYEFLGNKNNGLDLIEKFNLHGNSVLVTSRYEEPLIRKRCADLGVRQIPKGMAPFVPIELQKEFVKVDAVLLDDDSLVAMAWQFGAKQKNKSILYFSDESSFLNSTENINPATPIYVDVNLANGVRGQDVAQKLFNKGFKNLNLATGYPSDAVDTLPFIRNIIGKDFPF